MMKGEFYMLHSPNLVLHPPKIKHQTNLMAVFSRCLEGFAPAIVSHVLYQASWNFGRGKLKTAAGNEKHGVHGFWRSMLLAFRYGIVVLLAGWFTVPTPTNQKINTHEPAGPDGTTRWYFGTKWVNLFGFMKFFAVFSPSFSHWFWPGVWAGPSK